MLSSPPIDRCFGKGYPAADDSPRTSTNEHPELLCMLSLSGWISGVQGNRVLVFRSVQCENSFLWLEWGDCSRARVNPPYMLGDVKRHGKRHQFRTTLNQNFLSMNHPKHNANFQSNHELLVIQWLFCVAEHWFPQVQIINIVGEKKIESPYSAQKSVLLNFLEVQFFRSWFFLFF